MSLPYLAENAESPVRLALGPLPFQELVTALLVAFRHKLERALLLWLGHFVPIADVT